MAIKDVGKGWGDLNVSLSDWRCPKCIKNYPISEWNIIRGIVNGHDLEGRKCPTCEFQAFQHHETMEMVPQGDL